MNETSETRRGRGRPRREGANEEILSVARELLRERGYRDFTVDMIAERTGIAKTTIYRRYPSKGALAAAAIAPMNALTDTDDVTAVLRETSSVLRLLTAPEGEALEVLKAVIEPRRARIAELLAKNGDHAAELRADLLVGALLSRLLVGRTALQDEESIVAAVLG
ncbi:MAG TPA: helix-turn-helix domain-containing protein [Thermoanaerobaculia bacterium]|nr:helix-turn-helix domain-containing protein [Thermoanaerobaculia bacterium]